MEEGSDVLRYQPPMRQGLYDPANERDACGLGFIAHIKGQKSHAIVTQALSILKNLTHRGATGADPLQGDGAGILIQLPDRFLRRVCGAQGLTLPAIGQYGVGMVFLPKEPASRMACMQEIERAVASEGQMLLGWRDVPTNNTGLSLRTKEVEPVIRQVFIARGSNAMDQDALERKLYIIRKKSGHAIQALKLRHGKEFYVPSMSTRTLVYKGMLLAHQVGEYFLDLTDETMVSALAMVHQRFSTNTFPTWDLAHPFRLVCHNGEINTLRGNVNWIRARQHGIASTVLGEDLDKIWPLIYDGQSDSASFDNALELLVMGGYPLAHAMMLMIPEAWAGNPLMDEDRRAFYEYHAALMEPWDGPAAMAFTDGRQIGATLDRNGLRPARFVVTDDDYIVMASEVGVLDIPERKIVKKWRLQPGKMLLVDMEQGRIIDDEELKRTLATAKPYRDWITRSRIALDALPEPAPPQVSAVPLLDRQQAFGYTQEDLRIILAPMAQAGEEAIGSMGNDAALPVLSSRPKVFYNYFKQLFAQVTNPPIDPIREELVMSLVTFIGPRPNLLGIDEDVAADAPRGAAAGPHQRRDGEDPPHRAVHRRRVQRLRARHLLSGRVGRERHGGRARVAVRRGRGRDPPRLQHPDRVRPQGVGRADADPGAARDGGRAPAPGAQGPAHEHRPRRRDGLGARGPPLRAARGLRRRGDPPVPRARNARLARRRRARPGPAGIRVPLHQGDLQGALQGDVEDGHLHLPVVLRRADLRGGRPAARVRRQVLHRHREQRRGHRAVRGRRGGASPAPAGVRRRSAARARARRGRRIPVPRPRRGAHVDAGLDRQAAARGARRELRDLQGIRGADQRPDAAADDAARTVRVPVRGGADRRSTKSSRRRRSSSASRPAR